MGWRDNISKDARHIVCLSGGKDSSALAIYLRDKIPNIEYVFSDTGEELPETYEYMYKLQDFLGKKIIWLKSEKNFKYYLDYFNGVLPGPKLRWCTKRLKLDPYNKFVGNDPVFSYVGIRADETTRKGFIPKKDNLVTVFPFVEDNYIKSDIFRILEDVGIGLPEYYKWRSRSGCYFCFFQRKIEWIGLLEYHPDLYELASSYEKKDFTWIQYESLADLKQPAKIEEIKRNFARAEFLRSKRFVSNQRLCELWNCDV